MKKHMKLVIVLAAALAIAAACIAGYLFWQNQKQYHATYIVIDDVEYLRTVTKLDLSGRPVGQLEKLEELTTLEELDLRDTGITLEEYEQLRAALPDCTIHWSVPFQNTFWDNDSRALTVSHLSESDMDVLTYFPQLKEIWALECTDYEALMALQQAYPQLRMNDKVTVAGKDYINYANSLTITDLDIAEFREKIAYLPEVTYVDLDGDLPALAELAQLREDYPRIAFDYDFEIFGIQVNSMDEFLDLSGQKFESVEEVEKILPYFCNLKKIDMVDCGFSNDTMDALNKRHLDVKFVWKVNVCGLWLRTDAKYFMPVKNKLKKVNGYACQNLRYCTDMEVLDFGHYGISNVDFVQYMPNLKYLLLCEATIPDLNAIGKCTSLLYLELQMSQTVTDFWPLTNLTNLRDLNVADVTYRDSAPLMQMTWLDRLWVAKNGLGSATRAMLYEALPNTMIVFQSTGHTTSGFRHTPQYYAQRDILEMYYGAN